MVLIRYTDLLCFQQKSPIINSIQHRLVMGFWESFPVNAEIRLDG